MSPKAILIVAIRLFVIVWGMYAINIFYFADTTMQLKTQHYLIVLGLCVICWLFMWFFPATIANKLLPEYAQQAEEIPQQPITWLTTGIVLIGIWGLYRATIDMVSWLTFLLALSGTQAIQTAWEVILPDQKASIITTVIEFIFALFLILRANKVSQIIRKNIR